MVDWLARAVEVLPEIQEDFDYPFEDGPMSLWLGIWRFFEVAYRSPRDDDFIRRIYEFADWCSAQERGRSAGDDLLTCVAVCFYEHIPTDREARADMPRWFGRDDIVLMRETFSYFLNSEEFEQLLAQFDPPHSNRKAEQAHKAKRQGKRK